MTDHQYQMIMTSIEKLDKRLEAHIKAGETLRETVAILASQNLDARLSIMERRDQHRVGFVAGASAIVSSLITSGILAAAFSFIKSGS